MKKKDYQKPTMNVVQLKHRTSLLVGSDPVAAPNKASIDNYEDGEFSW